MSRRVPQCARSTMELLNELERDHELEILRDYLTKYNLFPRTRDPSTAPIRFEELKELAKYWKLHRQRGFWRNHPEKEDLVRALHKHIDTKILPNGNWIKKNESLKPHPPPTIPERKTKTMERQKSVKPLTSYHGDLFGQRGCYDGGIIYLSRLGRRGKRDSSGSLSSRTLNQNDEYKMNEIEDDMIQEDDSNQKGYGERHMKRKCASSLYQLSLEEGNEEALCNDATVPALVRLCMFEDTETKRICSAVLVNLTCNPSLCTLMLEEGALTGLSELSKCQNEEIRRNTALALCRISCDKQGQHRLLHEGVTSLFSLLHSLDCPTRGACIKALLNLSSLTTVPLGEGVIQAVIQSCHHHEEDEEEENHLKSCASMIKNMSVVPGYRIKAIEDGILEGVVQLMKNENQDVQTLLAEAIYNFSGIPQNHSSLANPTILQLFQQFLVSTNTQVQSLCIQTLSNLSCTPNAIDNLVAANLLPSIMAIGGNAAMQSNQQHIAQVLSNLAAATTLKNNNIQELLIKTGAVPVLVHFLKEGDVATKQHAVLTLCNLMIHPGTRTELVQYNILPLLIDLSSSSNSGINEICSLALFNLSCDYDLREWIAEEKTLQAIYQLSQNKNNNLFKSTSNPKHIMTSCQKYCMGCLYNLSFDPRCRTPLVTQYSLNTLLDLYNIMIPNDIYTAQGSAILCNLSFSPECRILIGKENQGGENSDQPILNSTDNANKKTDHGAKVGSSKDASVGMNKETTVGEGISLIKRFSESNMMEVLLCCASTLCNIANDSKATQAIMEMLMQLSHTLFPRVTLVCAAAFSKLSLNQERVQVLASNPEVASILTVMLRSGLEDIQMNAAIALCNLAAITLVACEKSSSSSPLWKEGTIPDFIVNSLLRVNSNATKEICARALYNILSHDDCRPVHIKEGVLYALVKLARLESIETRSLCVVALEHLSCDLAMVPILLDMNVVQVLTSICELDGLTTEVRQKVASCLCHLSQIKSNENTLLDGGTITAIKLLVDGEGEKDETTLMNCAVTLSNLSWCDKGCDAMSTPTGITVLLKMIAASTPKIKQYGLNILCNLSQHIPLHSNLHDSEVVKVVLTQLISDSPPLEGTSSLIAMLFLGNLVSQTSNLSHLLTKNPLVPNLTTWLKCDDLSEECVAIVLQIFVTLSFQKELVDTVVSQGCIQGIVAVCKKRLSSLTIQADCITCLHNFSISSDSKVLIQDGILEALQSIIGSSKLDITMQRRCASMIRNLSIRKEIPSQQHSCSSNLSQHSEEDTIGKTIVSATLLCTCSNPKESCSCSCSNETLEIPTTPITPITETKSLVCKGLENYIVSFVKVLSENHDIESCQDCSSSLYNVLGDKQCHQQLVDEGLVQILAHLSQSGSAEVIQICSICIAELNTDLRLEIKTTHGGILQTLVNMSDMEQHTLTKVETSAKEKSKLVLERDTCWDLKLGLSLEMNEPLTTSPWVAKTISPEEQNFVLQEPKDYMHSLEGVSAESACCVKDTLSGQFDLMADDRKKITLKKQPKLLPSRRNSVDSAVIQESRMEMKEIFRCDSSSSSFCDSSSHPRDSLDPLVDPEFESVYPLDRDHDTGKVPSLDRETTGKVTTSDREYSRSSLGNIIRTPSPTSHTTTNLHHPKISSKHGNDKEHRIKSLTSGRSNPSTGTNKSTKKPIGRNAVNTVGILPML